MKRYILYTTSKSSWFREQADIFAKEISKTKGRGEVVIEKVVTKTKVVKEKGQEVTKYVDREIVKYDVKFAPGGECEIPKEFIKAHNEAAK